MRRPLWNALALATTAAALVTTTSIRSTNRRHTRPVHTETRPRSLLHQQQPQQHASSHPQVAIEELTLNCSDGTQLAAQRYYVTSTQVDHDDTTSTSTSTSTSTTSRSTGTILCLHGWLDNCRSFAQVAPAVCHHMNDNMTRTEVIALDFPGHGRSSHKSVDAPPMVQAELAYYVSEAMDQLRSGSSSSTTTIGQPQQQQQQQHDHTFTLMGHSLGAGVATLVAAAIPEDVDQLILLDGAGFLARPASETAHHVRNHIRRRKLVQRRQNPTNNNSSNSSNNNKKDTPRSYPTLGHAIATRIQAAHSMPGTQSLSYQAAREIVLRATHVDRFSASTPAWLTTTTTTTTTTTDNNNNNHNNKEEKEKEEDSSYDGPVQFRHDARFAWPSLMYMTQDQVEAVLETCGQTHHNTRICVLLAETGWPFDADHLHRALERLQPHTYHPSLPGSHYFHADPETSTAVVDAIVDFLKSNE